MLTIIKSTLSEIDENSLSNVIVAGKVIQSSDYSFEPSNDDGWKLTIEGQKVTGDICIKMEPNLAPTQFVAYLANPSSDGFTITNTEVKIGESFSTIIKSTTSILNENSLVNVIVSEKPLQSTDYSFEPSNDDGWRLTIEGQKVTGDICITMKKTGSIDETGGITEDTVTKTIEFHSDPDLRMDPFSFGKFKIDDSLVEGDNKVKCHAILTIPNLGGFCFEVGDYGFSSYGSGLAGGFEYWIFDNSTKSCYLNFYIHNDLADKFTINQEEEIIVNIYRKNLSDAKMVLAYSSDAQGIDPFKIKKID